MTRTLGLLVVVGAILSFGCTHVAAFQRGKLAHPTMTTDDAAGPAEAHIHAVHEGAMGGGGAAESGCGCN